MASSKKKRIGIEYNAPVTLTFSLLCVAVLLLHQYVVKTGTLLLFVAPGSQSGPFPFDYRNPLHYIRLFTHVLGHRDWSHLVGNLSLLLLLGPILEERFGSKMLLVMVVATAFVTGVINACFIPQGLMGASGVVFMMILCSSYSTIDRSKIPLTFILVCLIYLGKEFLSLGNSQITGISNIAHLVGGLCGSIFGYLAVPSKKKSPARKNTSHNSAKKEISKTGDVETLFETDTVRVTK